jgi:hypothetical protein
MFFSTKNGIAPILNLMTKYLFWHDQNYNKYKYRGVKNFNIKKLSIKCRFTILTLDLSYNFFGW